jgi:hypothetical protein
LAGLLVAGGIMAQVPLTTYWLQPPLNGCDGQWAFGPVSALLDSCGNGSWIFDPFGCVNFPFGIPPFPNVNGDTIVVELCSLPCSFQMMSANLPGSLCLICDASYPTSVREQHQAYDDIVVFPNPANDFVRLTNSDQLACEQQITICDVTGQTIKVLNLEHGSLLVDLSDVRPGAYFARASCTGLGLTRMVRFLKE